MFMDKELEEALHWNLVPPYWCLLFSIGPLPTFLCFLLCLFHHICVYRDLALLGKSFQVTLESSYHHILWPLGEQYCGTYCRSWTLEDSCFWLINLFIAPACKISGLKKAHTHTCRRYIFQSCNNSTLNTVFWWKSFHMQKRKPKPSGLQISLLLGISKWHHGNERVNWIQQCRVIIVC